ncbi:MAG: hypothetical protein KF812_03295 [Fimbriimonadaceae bacterium]|nr:hypothetical protein [Fimbriimonadaceae bacterium]
MRKLPWGIASLMTVVLFSAVACNQNDDPSQAGVAPDGYNTTGSTSGSPTASVGEGSGGTNPGSPGTPSTPGANPSASAPVSSTPDGTAVQAPAAQVQSGEVALRLKVKKGDSFRFKQTSVSEVRNPQANQGGAETVKVTSVQDQIVKITDVKNDVFDVEYTNKVPQVTVVPESASQIARMMGGNQTEDVVTTSTFSSLGQPGATTGASMMASSAISMAGFMGLVFPTDGVKAGETWNNTIDLTKMLPAMPGASVANGETRVTYTLKSVNSGAGTATIDVKMSGAPEITMRMSGAGRGEGSSAPQAQEIKLKLTMTLTGSVTISLADGVARTANYSIATKTEGGPAMGNQDMKITIVRQ